MLPRATRRSALPSPGPLPRSRRRPAARALLLAGLLALAACGRERAPGGAGTLEGGPDGLRTLVLEGTPHEMGWWHGHLLKAPILAAREAWPRRFYERMGAAGSRPEARAKRAGLEQWIEAAVDQTRHRLSERMTQELEGMSEAIGLEPEELLRVDVMRDALRFQGMEAGLGGAAGLARLPGGFEARVYWSGPDAREGPPDLLIQRKPAGHPPTVCATWPGSLGAVAALTADGRGFVLAEVEFRSRRRMGMGGGRPFHVAAREALEEHYDAASLHAASQATVGHLLLAFAAGAEDGPRVQAIASVEIFQGTSEAIGALGEDGFLAIGPHEDAADPAARRLREEVVAPVGLELEERFLRLARHAGEGPQPRAVVRRIGDRLSLALHVAGGASVAVELAYAER